MTTYGINDNRKLTQDGSAADGIKPRIYFRERPVFELTSEDIHAGDNLRLAVDVDKDFLATAPMAVATGEGEEGSATFALNCATSRFEEVINGRTCLVCAYIQLTRWDGGNCEVLVDDRCYVGSLVSVTGDDVEILPKPVTIPVPDAEDAGKVIGVDDNGNYALRDAGGGGSAEQATAAEIDARESTTHAITPNNLDYAGRSVVPNITTIPAETTAYALLDATATTNNHSWQYRHTPDAAATYTFPAVTDTAVAHYIRLTIDFATVLTYAFEDSAGTALTPLFTPTIAAGDVYEFDCEYSAAKSTWLIVPHKQGAVSDDYVMQSEVGAANGVAGLDENGEVPQAQMHKLQSATATGYGAVRVQLNGSNGVNISSSGYLRLIASPNADIDSRSTITKIITPSNLNYAVTAALTDSNKIQLTDAQKASAQDTIGAYGTLHLDAAPTTSTVGAFGQRAIVDSTGKAYTCTAVTVDETDPDNPVTTYEWRGDINETGGVITSGNLTITGRGRLNIGLADDPNDWSVFGLIRNGTYITTNTSNCRGVILSGQNLSGSGFSKTQTVLGVHNVPSDSIITVGHGSDNAKMNICELGYDGDLYIAGRHQQGITTIPTATTAYTLAEGMQEHVPSSASIYTLPAIPERIIASGMYFTRNTATDGTGYYGWLNGTTNRYTASATPSVGDNTYTNTALTAGAKAITAIDERTHECILTVRFSANVLTYAFEDAAGNAITPLPLAGTIADGSVVCFRCTWEALLNQWVIMPVMLGTYEEAEP